MTAVEIVAGILAEHSTFAWNRSLTRIRCSADGCGAVMDADDGTDAIFVFARHQAEQLPAAAPVAVGAPAEPESSPEHAPEPAEPPADEPAIEGHSVETALSETALNKTALSEEPLAEPDLSQPAQAEPEQIEAEEPVEEPVAPAPEVPTPEQSVEDQAAAVAEAPEKAPVKKARRDTKALGSTIAEIKKGDRVTAFFNHPRYGEFAVEGTVIQGGAGQDRNQLMVGGWYLNIGERAAKYVQDLVIVATAGNHEFDIQKPSESTEHVGIGG